VKKILAVVLTFTMVLCLLPSAALAADKADQYETEAQKLDISNAEIVLDGTVLEYDGTQKVQGIKSVTLSAGDNIYAVDDYEIVGNTDRATEAGVYELKISGKGIFTGTAVAKWFCEWHGNA
jgi:hypothetical protein